MAGCVSGFGLSNVLNVRNELVLKKLWGQSLVFDNVRFKSLVTEAAFTRLGRNIGYRHVSMKKKQRLVVMSNISHSQAEPQSGGAATTVTKEGNDGVISKDVKVLDANEGSKIDSDGNGGNGKYVGGNGGGGRGGGGGDGGGDGSEENDYEEKEFGPLMKFEEVMKEVEARGATLPSDMLEAAKNVGIRKLLLLRYLDLQGSSWPLGFLIRSWGMLRNRMLADPSFLFKIGTEIVIDSCCATFAEVQKRGEDFWAEFELYVADLLVGLVVNIALVGMLAPYVRIGQPSVSKGFLGRMQRAYGALPSSVFEAERPGCRFSVNQRLATYFYKGILYGSVGFGCGIIGQGIANLIMTAKRSIKKSEEDIPVPPLLKSAALWGVFLAVSSNTRYQIVNGLERLVEASALAKQVPPVALAFTIGVRFANNVYGGMQFVDWARWSGNETFEKLASMSLIANITVYLRTRYNMNGILLVNVVSIWSGSSNLTSIPGALISDTYLGKFYTLLFGSIASLLGMGIITLTAGIDELRPPACNEQADCVEPKGWQLSILYAGLALLAIGSGGIRPCNIAFGADQFDTRTPKGKTQLESFFNWWYFSFTVALVIALTVVVYIQTNVSWVIGFVIPTACLFLSTVIFLIGHHTYIIKKPQGSVFVDVAKVVTAACRKRKQKVNDGQDSAEKSFYDPPPSPLLESYSQNVKLPHTVKFRCLDKAALITDSIELDSQGKAKNNWRLCSIQQVEQLKMLLGMVPVWITGIVCFLAMDQQNTIGILQAIQMNKTIQNFNFPPAWIGLMSMITLALWIFIYERVYLPLTHKITGKKQRLTMTQRVTIGILMSIVTLTIAGIVERNRRISALEHGSFESPLSILLLLPQFAFSGLIEAFAAVALMELLTTQLPESMRTVSGTIFFLSLSIASYMNSLLINIIHVVTGKNNGQAPWLGGTDLNKNTVEYFYFLVAGIEVLNLLYFTFFASRYVSNNDAKNEKESEKKDLEESV
ncbi:hypothetical protein Q3G72_025003 [Acer saccharum]|nr:hypothetical protein Q3G72_025003 [Acer saccharum]